MENPKPVANLMGQSRS